jgi:hypothetical protein
MAQIKEQIPRDDGFAFPLQPSTDLGLAMLIAESEDGRRLEKGEDAVLCPFLYQVWARGTDGRYRLACEIADLLN